jgi:opacity protein-like surface antigen
LKNTDNVNWITNGLLAAGLAVLIISSFAAIAGAQTTTGDDSNRQKYLASNQAGIRIGGWANRGGMPLDSFALGGDYYLTEFGSGSFYLEGHYSHRFKPSWMAEISIGIVSRGDVTLVDALGSSSIGALQIYPILTKLKFYPFGSHAPKLNPYLMAGGGFYYGRHDIQITAGYNQALKQAFGEDTETDFNYVVGGGLDLQVASMIALELQAQYMPIKFSGDLIGISDYSALTITIGVKYLTTSKKKNSNGNHKLHSRRGR